MENFIYCAVDIPQALSDIHTYLSLTIAAPADDVIIFYQHKDVTEIENNLSKESVCVCEWFVDNKLSIHFSEDKTKFILFSTEKNLPAFNITFNNNRIKQFHTVEYLGCYLDANLGGESMAMKSIQIFSSYVDKMSS